MKSPSWYAVAVRKENGTIKLIKEHHESIVKQKKWLNIPLLRGILYLYEMTVLGMKSLTWSANQQVSEQEEITALELIITISISLLLSIGIFVVAPFFLTKLITSDSGV